MIVAGLKNNRPDNYEIEDSLNTLIKAEEIKQNKDLLGEVIKYAETKKAAISSIADLKAAYNKKVMEDDSNGKEEKIKKSEEVSSDYIDRVEQAREEAQAPSEIPIVKILDESEPE